MTNNRNPNSLKNREVQQKSQDLDVVRATVLDTIPEIHSVRVNPRGDSAPFVAPVVAPMYGSQTLPDVGERVMVLFLTATSGIVLGSVYLLDGDDPPNTNGGDLVFGNGTGSRLTVHEDGHITIQTDGLQRIDIDHQSAATQMSADQSVAGDGVYYELNFDTVDDDPEELFDATDHSFTIRNDGQHRLDSTIEIPLPGQNNAYTLALFRNGSEMKRKNRQSAVNEPLSLTVSTQMKLDAGDVIDVRLRHNRGSASTVESDAVATEFTIQRKGI